MDGQNELFLYCSSMSGTGGGTYLVYKKLGTGYQHMGEISFASIRVLPLEKERHPMMITYWHMGAGEGVVSLVVHDGMKFNILKSVEIYCGDSGTDEGRRVAKELFDSDHVSHETLFTVINSRCQRR